MKQIPLRTVRVRLRPCRPSTRPGPLAAALATSFVCLTATAQSPALDPVFVTATRSAQPLKDVLASVSVFTREDIERQAGGAVADLLRGAPGFELSRNGGPAAFTSLFLRGTESRFTAVLVDGVRVDSQATGGASWNAIPLAQIERIEILRGPASSVYGSDAIGGVVQIFTRRATEGLVPEVGVGIGNLGTAKADASLRGAQGALDFALSAAYERSKGFNAIGQPTRSDYINPDRDGYRSKSFSGRVGLKLNEVHRLDVSTLISRLDSQYDDFLSAADDHSRQRVDTYGGSWTAKWSPNWTSRVTATQSTDRYETTPSPYLAETRLRTYAWQNDLSFGAHRFNATLERREDRLENTGLSASPSGNTGDRSQDSIGLGYGLRLGAFELQANARRDRDSEFGGHDSGSLALGYDLTAGLRLRGSAGSAFRAPTLYQRFSDYGNPALVPESSRNVEFGIDLTQGVTRAGITAYRNRVTDLITFGAPGPCRSTFGCYRNTARATLQGVTLDGRSALAGINLSGSIDLQSPKDATSGLLLARRARRHAALQADTDLAGWNVGAQWLASGPRWDDAANSKRLGGYALLNLNARYRFAPQWSLLMRIDNAFNRDYQTALDYPSAPRTAFIGVRWSPGG